MSECQICGKEVDDYEEEYCCSGHECGCGGMPLEPCICSAKCWDELNKPAEPKPLGPIKIYSIECS